jgi:DNA-binding transcriptional MerR regulator
MSSKSSLRSGEVARLMGISADTVRMYERKGLLAPHRAANGYRCYSEESVARVRLIRAALSIGFKIDELARILKVRDSGGAPCRAVRELAQSKVRALDSQIEQLTSLRAQLRQVLKDWDRQLKAMPAGQRAGLLERLVSACSNARALPPHFYAALSKEAGK